MLTVEFFASPALHESDDPKDNPAQEPELTLTLGPFEWVQLTYNILRVAPDSDPIAFFDDGLWKVDIMRTSRPDSQWAVVAPAPDSRVFSDITIRED